MKVLLRVGSSPNLDDPTALDELLQTESWQTLLTFAREMARKSLPFPILRSQYHRTNMAISFAKTKTKK